jgi:hypothetical protein
MDLEISLVAEQIVAMDQVGSTEYFFAAQKKT